MGGKNENKRIASPESVPIHLKYYIDPKQLGSSAYANNVDTDQTVFEGETAPQRQNGISLHCLQLYFVYTCTNNVSLIAEE